MFRVDGFQTLSMAGRTDRWIFTELATRHGLPVDSAALSTFTDCYLSHLAREIHEPGPGKGVLPGVTALLDVLAARPDVSLALLTGNIARGARIKLEYFDLWRYFGGGGFGDRALDRTDLFADALADVAARSGETFDPSRVVIVGDTPLDIAVAVATGARSLGVATGRYGVDALREAGADAALPDLGDTHAALAALDLAGSG